MSIMSNTHDDMYEF